MEPELHLHGTHKRIGPVRASKRIAGVEYVALVGDVGADEAQHPTLSERLSYRQIKRVVSREMIRTVAVKKPGAVVERDRGEAAPRQVPIEARRKRVALVVIEVERISRRRR